VEFQHIPADVAISSESVPQVQIWLRGPQRVVRAVNAGDLHATLDLESTSRLIGERTFELTPAQIHAPHGVEVVQVVPSEIHLTFDRPAVRQVSVTPRLSGKLPNGVEPHVTAEPASVTIEGPQARVQAVQAVLTDPVDISGITGAVTFTVNAYVPDPLVRLRQPTQVRVTVNVAKSQ